MSWTPTQHQRIAIKVSVTLLFLGALVVAAMTAWYFRRAYYGDDADGATALLAMLISDRGVAVDTFRVFLAALPAFAMAVCIRRQGVLSRFGLVTLGLLVLTIVISSPAAIFLDPRQDSPESQAVAEQVVELSKDLSKFALTYVFMLLGLGTIADASDDDKGK